MSSRGAGAGLEGSEAGGEEADGLWWLTSAMMAARDHFWLPIGQTLVAILYGLYRRLTWFNLMIFILKYVPTGIYMFKMLKTVYRTSRERIKQKQMELEDLQLQIQIVDTKLCVRVAEFTERTEQLRRNADRLRSLFARVRDMNPALEHAAEPSAPDHASVLDDTATRLTPEEERDFIMTLLKELKEGEQLATSERDKLDRLDHEQSAGDEPQPDNSVYSSVSDADSKKQYRVKIVKVTNVYKVACLKHYIKQKRLRQATEQAMLKKTCEDIKKHLESWQKSLNDVTYNKLSSDHASLDMASQEAMGDYSKPNLREFSDSDSELKTSCTDICYDEYNLNWSQNPYSYESPEPAECKELFEGECRPACECGAGALYMLPEETSSQVAIEQVATRDARAI